MKSAKNNLREAFRPIRDEILSNPNNRCYICNSKESLTIHHIIPISFGGLNNPENLKTLCEKCHQQFHNYSKINPTDKYLIERLERLKNQNEINKKRKTP